MVNFNALTQVVKGGRVTKPTVALRPMDPFKNFSVIKVNISRKVCTFIDGLISSTDLSHIGNDFWKMMVEKVRGNCTNSSLVRIIFLRSAIECLTKKIIFKHNAKYGLVVNVDEANCVVVTTNRHGYCL